MIWVVPRDGQHSNRSKMEELVHIVLYKTVAMEWQSFWVEPTCSTQAKLKSSGYAHNYGCGVFREEEEKKKKKSNTPYSQKKTWVHYYLKERP